MKESISTTDGSPQTLPEIRDLMRIDSALVTDQHLLALLLATGSRRQRVGQPDRSWSVMEMAEELYTELGGKLTYLRDAGRLCRQRFGRGAAACDRVSAGVWLASPRHMPETEKRSEAELIAAVLGAEEPDKEGAARLIEEFGNPQELLRSMSVDAFESYRTEGVARVRFPMGDFEGASFCRLVAVVELRARCGGCSSPISSSPALEPGMLGLESSELVEVLNPANYLHPEFRATLLKLLRSHPQLADDFNKLDRLAADAQTSDCYLAVEASLMLEWLCRYRTWSRPRQVLGEDVPYDRLLAIAQAKLARSAGEPLRVLEVQALLTDAAQDLAAGPIGKFVEALTERKLPKSIVEAAIEEANKLLLPQHRRRLEPSGVTRRQVAAGERHRGQDVGGAGDGHGVLRGDAAEQIREVAGQQ